ncbi:MAG: TonB-dependent receptor [Sulfurimonas sp.]|uniref:TonB-dependent receptor plug domain-containing protein n=1 Tax=Sulfurimonas sp. TaxID=2022749 RepID=UPI00260D6991|nr:TonB-dependent receptor [Sulfurimonas sp.]MDD5373394.1 TonB-dependent receptor [Sulfurimonas sp.]
MKISLVLILLTALLFGEEKNLNELLSEYREAGELYNETKEENSGNVIVYSRSDLDRMQAYTLNDILKTIRLFTLKNTKIGMNTLVKSPYSEATTSSVRVFINSHELKSITAGTAMAQYGKMGLNFIDHIEVYQASNSISFGGEPGNMTIRMYTKDPSREDATIIQTSINSEDGGGRAQLIEAKKLDEYSYLANIDVGKSNYDKHNAANGAKLSRDGKRIQAYVSLQKEDNFLVELGAGGENSDIFAGFGPSVRGGSFDSKSMYVNFTKYFDNDLKLILGSDYEEIKVRNLDSMGITLQDRTKAYDLSIENGAQTNNAILEKKAIYGDNYILVGAETRFKKFFLNELKSNGVDKPVIVGPRDLDIYMLYIEDEYKFNKNHSATLGAKVDYYKNYMSESATQKLIRFAYNGQLRDDFSLKFFTQKNYTYPIFAQTTFSPLYYPNPNLKATTGNLVKIEGEYKKDALTLTLGVGGSKSKNGIAFDRVSNRYINNPDTADFRQLFINTKYKFNEDNKLFVEYFIADKDKTHLGSDNGALVQLFNKVGRFDFYNELVYRSAYIDMMGYEIDAGYDYTAGAIYHYSKNLDLKVKGENIFDRASQSNINGVFTSAIERRAIFTLEYTF